MAEQAQQFRVSIRPSANYRSVADDLAADLKEIRGIRHVGPGAKCDIVVSLGGPPTDADEAWWIELVHSGTPDGSAFAALEIADDIPLAGIELCSRIRGVPFTIGEAWLRVDPYSPTRLRERSMDAARTVIVQALKRRVRGTDTALQRSGPRTVELSPSDRRRLGVRRAAGFALTQLDETTRSDHWAIGVVDAPIERFLEPNFRPEVVWSPDDGPEVFAADPFAIVDGAGLRILYERFDFRLGRGTIASRSYSHGGWGPEETLLEVPTHLSYPFTFEHDGATLVVPENAAGDGVHVYELGTRPLRWTKKVLDFPCLDPTLFLHDGLWWMFGTDARIAHVDVLHAWVSEDGPLGPWRAHEMNPLKVDIRSSRPAGTPFRVDGQLYRPAQDGTAGYGGGVSMNRIDVLTQNDFRETTVRRILPLPGRKSGLHTLSSAGESTVVDGKALRVVPSTLAERFAGRARRAFRRNG